MRIGPHELISRVVLAPMAGVTDRPFREIARRFGAGLAVSEMITSDQRLWNSRKSERRLDHHGEAAPHSVQIAGSDPQMMAAAARACVEHGAQIVDINMGCPAKKVCRRAAGSALLADEALVAAILRAVTAAVDVPVTLKIRTGTSPGQRNAVSIARIAEDAGIQALAVHGRTRACRFEGAVEYDTIAAVCQAVTIPVIANGDIDSPQKALAVLRHTGADAVMIGRAAQGRPWLLGQIAAAIDGRPMPATPGLEQQRLHLLRHLHALHAFYGEEQGVRIARKHIGWYLEAHQREQWRPLFNRLDSAAEQCDTIHRIFDHHPFEEGRAA